MVFLSLYIVVGEINLLHAAVIRAFLLLESTPVERSHYSLSRSWQQTLVFFPVWAAMEGACEYLYTAKASHVLQAQGRLK